MTEVTEHKYIFDHTLQHMGSSTRGLEPMPPAVGALILNHWTTGEVPVLIENEEKRDNYR